MADGEVPRTTDSQREIRFDRSRPGIYNLLTIYRVLSGEDPAAIEARFEGKGYGDFKRALADLVIDSVSPIQRRCRELLDSGELDDLLAAGAAKAGAVANETLRHAKYALGLL